MTTELTMAIDVGTGSVRVALVGRNGRIVSVQSREQEQIVPEFGWSQQRPVDWWDGVVAAIRATLNEIGDAAGRIEAVVACGQMHGTVLIDDHGKLTRDTAPLWNDKRTASHVAAFESVNRPESYLSKTANPPTPAWPAFKLQWIRDKEPEAYRRASAVMMPKDYINFRLTGEIAMDRTEAACSFLMDPSTGDWSAEMCDRLDLDRHKLPTIRNPLEILGSVDRRASAETGLRQGTPVLVGGGDFPVALLGSGVSRPGQGSEMIGTSCIVTLVDDKPLIDPAISNIGTVDGNWGAFMLLESGGDAMRWARRAFHEKSLSYTDIVVKACEAPAGSDRLLFMPYLAGERFGAHRNARAQFFGISAGHGLPHMHRAVLEGVAFACRRHMQILEGVADRKFETIVASGGGVRTELWLKIKASVYDIPILVPAEAECGLIGCAALAATALGHYPTPADAASHLVHYDREILPDPRWVAQYAKMQPLFEKLYYHSQALYDDLDALA